MDTLTQSLRGELEKITEKLGIKIVELSARGAKNGFFINIVINKDGGITLRDCEKVSHFLNDRLEILKLLGEKNYSLHVSSPGIDRVFKDKNEYNLFKERDVKVILKEPLDDSSEELILRGKLHGITNNIVTIEATDRKLFIPLEKIRKTKLDS